MLGSARFAMRLATRTLVLLLTTLIVLTLVGVWYVALFDSVNGFVAATDHGRKLFGDFVAHYFPMGKKIWTTRAPSRGFLYSPIFAMALSPIAELPLASAKTLWGSIEVGATALLFAIPLLSLRGDRRALTSYGCYLLAFVTSYPVLHNFRWGQVSVVNTLLMLGAAYAYRSQRRLAAALMIALSVSIKFYPGLFLIYFLARRDRVIVLVALTVSALLLILLPAALLGVDETWRFYETTLTKASINVWIGRDTNSQYIGAVAERLSGVSTLRTVGGALGGLIVCVNLVLMILLALRSIEDAVLWAAALALLSIPFALRTSWPHYFVYLPFVQLLLARVMLAQPRGLWARVLEWGALALTVLLGSVLGFSLAPDFKAYGYWGCLFFANAILQLAVWSRLWPPLTGKSGAIRTVASV